MARLSHSGAMMMERESGLRKNTLGLFSLIFFVVAAASPLTGVVGGLPVAIAGGNSAGIATFYLLSCVILILFSIGFLAMSQYVKNSGAFYTYIRQGLGDNWGSSASIIALLAYISIQIAIVAMLGYFSAQLIAEQFSLAVPWWLCSITFLLITWFLSIKRVEVGGKILGILMLAEVGIVLLTDIVLLFKHGHHHSLQPFQPSVFLHGNLGISFIFTIAAFIGFESTAIYAEECKDPHKTIPQATICALLLITAFFCFTSWCLVQTYGAEQLIRLARKEPENLILMITRDNVGQWAVTAMSVLLISSLFAATVAFHNNISRYLFSMSRDGLIWQELCKIHPDNGTPHNASHLHSVIMLLLLIGLGAMNVDPMMHIFALGSAISTLCVLLLQLGVCAAVINFFRHQRHQRGTWSTFWAPLLSFFAMLFTVLLVINNLPVLVGGESKMTRMIPAVIVICSVLGYLWSKRVAIKRGCAEKN